MNITVAYSVILSRKILKWMHKVVFRFLEHIVIGGYGPQVALELTVGSAKNNGQVIVRISDILEYVKAAVPGAA